MSKIIASKVQRIDVYLAQVLDESRSKVSNLIKSKNVLVNNKEIKSSYILNIDDEISINLPENEEANIKYKADFEVEIIYEDDDLLVINKPNKIASHGCASLKEASLVEWLLEKGYKLADINGKIRAGIVHRLDKDTSGIMLVAKSNKAYLELAKQIKNREIDRIYLSVINHEVKQKNIEKYIKRNDSNRLKMQALSKDECLKKYGENEARWGKWARTHFINIKSNNFCLIAAKLESGRTHQIRTHLASVNRYILGDVIYADSKTKTLANRLMLHSFYISFKHPISGEFMEFISGNSKEFNEFIDKYFQVTLSLDFAKELLKEFKSK